MSELDEILRKVHEACHHKQIDEAKLSILALMRKCVPEKKMIWIDKHTGKPTNTIVMGGNYLTNHEAEPFNDCIDQTLANLENI